MKLFERRLAALVVSFAWCALANTAVAAPVHNHHDGKQMLGERLKKDGHHEIHKKGKFHASVEVKGGKVAGVHVRHEEKGEVPVTKYKTHKKMASTGPRLVYASLLQVQDQYLGTEYIGYAYTDEYGNQEIYWFPVDVILDGETGAIEYVPQGQ